MRRFSFRLEGVLSHRQWLEDEAKRALGVALQHAQALRVKKAAMQAEHKGLVEQRGSMPLLGPMEHMHFIRYGQKLLEDIKKQQEKIDEQQKMVLARTKALNKAMTERKKMDKLKERAFERYAKERKRKDTGTLDEVSTNFHGREKALS